MLENWRTTVGRRSDVHERHVEARNAGLESVVGSFITDCRLLIVLPGIVEQAKFGVEIGQRWPPIAVSMNMENNGLIAVIDDNVRVLDQLQGLLESVGYSTAVFSSAEDLLEYGHASDFGCVIADIGLPGMNGVSLRRRLSTSDADLPVILITARSDSALLSEVEISDELRFFEKPFDSARLLSAVATLVRRLDAPTPDD